MTRRGVSPVVGLALLIGATAVVAVGVLVVASAAVDTTADAAKQEQTEASMQAFADTTQRLTSGQSASEDVQIEGYDDGSTVVNATSGRIEVSVVENGTERTPPVIDQDLGAVRYRTPDGAVLAYQGGGVWKETDGHVQRVRAPPLNYGTNPRSNASSLTLPLTTVTGNATETGSFDGEVSVERREAYFPNRGRVGPIDGDHLELTIESEYAAGWESYIREETPAVVQEAHDGGVRGRVVANFTVVEINRTTTDGNVTRTPREPKNTTNTSEGKYFNVTGAVSGPSLYMEGGRQARIDGPVQVDEIDRTRQTVIEGPVTSWNGSMPEVSKEIGDLKANNTMQWRGPLDNSRMRSDHDISSGGMYRYQEIDISNHDLDVTADNETIIVVEEDFRLTGNSDFRVTGEGNVTVLVNGSIGLNSNGRQFGNPSDPDQVQVKTAGNLQVSGQPDYYSVLYAPDGTVTVEGDGRFEGAILANDTEVRGSEVVYHPVTGRVYGNQSTPGNGTGPIPGGTERTPPSHSSSFEGTGVGYLHVSETEVEVDD